MAVYRRVDDLRSPAGCLYTGISSGPNARYRVWEAFTFIFTNRRSSLSSSTFSSTSSPMARDCLWPDYRSPVKALSLHLVIAACLKTSVAFSIAVTNGGSHQWRTQDQDCICRGSGGFNPCTQRLTPCIRLEMFWGSILTPPLL